jgi:ABC-type sugar transport system permease subunit
MATFTPALNRAATPTPPNTSFIIYASIAFNAVIALVCIIVAINIFGIQEATATGIPALEQLIRLGRPVIVFVALVALVPAVIAVYSIINLLRRQNSGRYTALILQFLGMVIAAVAMIHLWGAFQSFEIVVDGIVQYPWMLLGFALAYALYWVGGRLGDPWGGRLTTAALALGTLTFVVIVFVINFLTAANSVLSAYANPLSWVTTILVVAFAWLFSRLLRLGQYFGETQDQLVAWQGWMMLAPNIIGFMFFFAGPLLLSFYLSFTNSTVGQVPEFIGLQNYGDAIALEFQWKDDAEAPAQSVMSFGYTPLGELNLGERTLVVGAKDRLFWLSLRNTMLFCLLLVPLAVIPALFLALILNSHLPGVNIFRAIYFLPSVAAVVGTALIWRWLYHPTIGFINYAITQVVNGLNGIGFQITDPQIEWLTGPGVVLYSMVLLSAWQVIGFNTVLFLAGLQGIPKDIYEASSIDGAGRWQTLRFMTLPMLAPTTFFVIITTVITGLQVFNEPYALFPSRPIPENATTAVYYLYNQGFFRFNFGYASSIAWVLFALIFGMTLIQFRLQRSNAYEG